MAGLKTISILSLIFVVALAGVSPVYAPVSPFTITLNPTAGCPGTSVSISANIFIGEAAGGGTGVAAASPLAFTYEVLSVPDGLVGKYDCGRRPLLGDTTLSAVICTFVVSESARCGHYTVTVTAPLDGSEPSSPAPFDVAGPCCAVGGSVQPVNTFTLLSPWLAAVGIVGCIGTAAVLAKKRRS
jgi:hypothetical protein